TGTGTGTGGSNPDGLSDAFVAAFGAGLPTGVTPVPLIGVKLTAKLNFAVQHADTLTITGAVAIPAGFTPTGAKLGLALGDLIPVFTLNAKGQGVLGTDKASVSIKSKKGVVAA